LRIPFSIGADAKEGPFWNVIGKQLRTEVRLSLQARSVKAHFEKVTFAGDASSPSASWELIPLSRWEMMFIRGQELLDWVVNGLLGALRLSRLRSPHL
jgi:hypothetical protein